MKTQSTVRMHMNGRLVSERGPVRINHDAKITYNDLEDIGIGIRSMDSALTGPAMSSGSIPGHMLETWLPGTLRVITQARNIDEIVGITTIGKWEDETINLRVSTPAAKAELYGDSTNIPLADYSQSTESRSVVRFEQGFQVGKLEEMRQSAAGYQAADEKRRAATESLDVSRNAVGFFGFNDGNSNVYGLLNDPNLVSYEAATSDWKTATFDQLTGDIIRMMSSIESQMGGSLRDESNFVLVLPTGYRVIMSRYSATGSGIPFGQWLRESYPNLRIVTAPEFVGAQASKDVAYLFVENAGDGDDSDIMSASAIQAVPVRYQVLGSENRIKGYIEDAINATAGVFIIRPWAFTRMTISA